MPKRCLLAAVFVLVLPSCRTEAPPVPKTAVEKFGGAIQNETAIPLATVLAKPDQYAGKTITVDGHVRKACEKKGCWMELASNAAAAAQGCRVTFKDYGFFVPLDSAGADAKVEGVVEVRTVAKDEVDHMVAEGATFEKRFADGSARELRIVASGVELRGRGG